MLGILFIVAVPLLALALVRFLDGATAQSRRRARLLGWLGQSKLWHVLVAVALTALVFAPFSGVGPPNAIPLLLALLVVLVLLVRAWRHEFLFLMSLRDDDLPGRYDKLIWALALLVAPPVGIWWFRAFREAHWPEPAPLKTDAPPQAI